MAADSRPPIRSHIGQIQARPVSQRESKPQAPADHSSFVSHPGFAILHFSPPAMNADSQFVAIHFPPLSEIRNSPRPRVPATLFPPSRPPALSCDIPRPIACPSFAYGRPLCIILPYHGLPLGRWVAYWFPMQRTGASSTVGNRAMITSYSSLHGGGWEGVGLSDQDNC